MHSSAVTRIQNVRVLRSQQFAEDAGPMAHPIRPEKVLEMNNFYTLTVYEKGSEVIRMLHTMIGAEKFRLGMDLYFKRFDGMAVTCDDFVNAMSDASGKDLSQFKLWYNHSGTPVIKAEEFFNEETNTFTLTLSQSLPLTHKQPSPQALHIPIKIEIISKVMGESTRKVLLELTKKQQSWSFTDFSHKPIVAMLADFSAPVKLIFEQEHDDLYTIINQAENSFCCWDAGQKLLMFYMQQLTFDANFVIPELLFSTISKLLDPNSDRAFLAEQLALPSFDEAASLMIDVDPVALVNARHSLTTSIANKTKRQLYNCYLVCKNDINPVNVIANRSLKNACLVYLSLLPEFQHLVAEQYQQSTSCDTSENMTDSLAALTCSAKNNLVGLTQQLKHFEQKWQQTTLVMDKWFALNASVESEDIFNKLDCLLNHQLFSLKNPNRARSLIGAFAVTNARYFHCSKGRGYHFLAEQIAKLNTINPQVASRLITPLIQYKNFNEMHQSMMKAELIKLHKLPDLSNDLSEKLDAALSSD
jgi:aminopeptidase N